MKRRHSRSRHRRPLANRHPKGKRYRSVDALLEDVSAKAFDTHASALKTVLHQRHGIYALYRRERLYYVGLATNLFSRVRQHTRDKHRRHWDRFSAYVTRRAEQVKELETLALRILEPDGNRVRGQLRGAEDLKRTLGQVIADEAAHNAAELLGGKWVNRAKRRAVRGAQGAKLLAALSGRRRLLRGWYKGEEYRGVLLKVGKIRVGRRKFDDPNKAAVHAVGKRRNGWYFWRYKDSAGKWQQLRMLKEA